MDQGHGTLYSITKDEAACMEHKIEWSTSKKDPVQRRKELVKVI